MVVLPVVFIRFMANNLPHGGLDHVSKDRQAVNGLSEKQES